MNAVARLTDVRKTYGATTALDGVSLELRSGEVLGLLGPNGAGKTTAVALLAGLRRADAGTVELLGGSPSDAAVRRRVGVTPQATGFPETLRVSEIADFVCRHYDNVRPVADVLARFQLTDLAQRQAGGLSGGQRRRLAVALAFAGSPEVVLLDEPTTGLDVESRRRVWDGVHAFVADHGGSVLLTTHDMAEVEALATHVVVLRHGEVVADDTVARVRALVGVKQVGFAGESDGNLPGAVRVERRDGRVLVMTTDADGLVRRLVTSGQQFADLEVRSASLEDAFLTLTGAES